MHHPPIKSPNDDAQRVQLSKVELEKALDHLTEAYDLAPDDSQLEAMLRSLRKLARAILNPCDRCRSLGYEAGRPYTCTDCRAGRDAATNVTT